VEAAHRIADYDATVGKTRTYYHEQSGKQRGDPLKAVEAIRTVVESANPPLHLILGAIALKRLRSKMEQWREETSTWESVTLGADFPEDK
jgi:hypothetical protein